MVSPFLSFLGGVAEAHRGAMQEVRARRAKKEELEEQRAYEEEAQKRKLIFAEKLKDVARVKNLANEKTLQRLELYDDGKKTGKVRSITDYFRTGDDDYTTGAYARGRDEKEDIYNRWKAISDFVSIDENVEKLKANAPAYSAFLRDIRALDARTKAAYTIKLDGSDYQQSLVTGEGLATGPSSIVRASPFLTRRIKELETGNATADYTVPTNQKVRAKNPTTGQEIQTNEVIDKAFAKWSKVNGFSRPDQHAAGLAALTEKAGYYNPDEGKEAPAIYKHINSPLGGMLMGKAQLGDDEIEVGAQYIKTTLTNKQTGGVRVNDLNKLVDVAHNATYKEREDRGLVNVRLKTIGFAKGARGSKLGAEIAEAKKVYQDSISLRRNLLIYRALKNEQGSGSDLTTRFQVLAQGAPQVAKELFEIGMGLFSSAENRYTARLTQGARNFLAREQKRIEGLKTSAKGGELASRAEAMRMGLAYQLAITFQGSGGGKTISDEDIRRQLVALSGNFLDMDQANAKIDALLGIVDNKIANASLFANLKDTDNIGKYYAAQRVQKMINTLLPGEAEYNRFISERVEGKAKGNLPLSQVSSGAQAARVLGPKYPKATLPVLQSWYGNNVKTNDQLEIAPEEQGDETRQLLVNQRAAYDWYKAVKRGDSREDLNKLRQKLQRESGSAIDLNTGSSYKLIYQDDGKVSTFEKPEKEPVIGGTGKVVIPAQRTKGKVIGGFDMDALFKGVTGNQGKQ